MQEKLEKQLDPLWDAANDKDTYLLQLQASLFQNTICNDFFSLFDDGYIEMFESGDAVR